MERGVARSSAVGAWPLPGLVTAARSAAAAAAAQGRDCGLPHLASAAAPRFRSCSWCRGSPRPVLGRCLGSCGSISGTRAGALRSLLGALPLLLPDRRRWFLGAHWRCDCGAAAPTLVGVAGCGPAAPAGRWRRLRSSAPDDRGGCGPGRRPARLRSARRIVAQAALLARAERHAARTRPATP